MRTWIIIAAAALLSSSALAQQDLVKGSDSQTETILDIYPNQKPTGSQDWVREYDGREFFEGWGIEKIQSFGYDGMYQYSFLARDLILGYEDIGFNGTYGNSLGIRMYTSALLHRLAPYRGANVWLVGTPGAGTDPTAALGGGTQQFFLTRRVNEFSIRTTPTESRGLRFVLGNWEQTKSGVMQVLARVGSPSVKVSAAIPNDNVTSETTMGVDAALGNASVINYRNVETKAGQLEGRGVPGTVTGVAPLNQLTRANSTTPAQVFKARAKITDWMYFSGVQTIKSRHDTGATKSAPHADISSTNLALTTLLGDALTIYTGFRRYNVDDETAIINTVPDDPDDPTVSHTFSTNQKSYTVEGTYTGLPKTYLKAGYERQDNSYSTSDFRPPWASLSTKWDIFRAGFRMYPYEQLNLQVNWEDWNDTTANFNATPNKRTKLDANGTYMLRDNLAFYASYNRSKQSNDQIRVDPVPLNNEQLRMEAAGQGFNGTLATTIVGGWYALTPKLTFDLNWSSTVMDSNALWVLGFTGANQQATNVPFNAVDDQWSLGANYQLTREWRMRGSYFSSNSYGKELISFTNGTVLPVFGPTWSPIRVDQLGWTLGVTRDLSVKDSLDLDYTMQRFEDKIDQANTGTYSLWSVSDQALLDIPMAKTKLGGASTASLRPFFAAELDVTRQLCHAFTNG